MATPVMIPNAFIWRRLHSLTGLWLVLFLISHLLTNSQAALIVGENGQGFVDAVDSIHHLPYLQVIEIILLGIPFAVHILYGLHRLFMAKTNSSPSDGTTPDMSGYSRNHAFTWMRLTSWLLLIGVIAHVVHMRFIEYPWHAEKDGHRYYMTALDVDSGLYTLSERLNVDLYDAKRIAEEASAIPAHAAVSGPAERSKIGFLSGPKAEVFSEKTLKDLRTEQDHLEERHWAEALTQRPIDDHQVVAVSKDFGTASLLIVRETFKSPFMVALYSLFVLAACYHGFNGLWTFLITWGVTLTERSQRLALWLSTGLMIVVAFLGLAAAIGTYWINLRN